MLSLAMYGLVHTGALLAAARIEPVVLHEEEGLAPISGTDGMLGMLSLAMYGLVHTGALLAAVRAANVSLA